MKAVSAFFSGLLFSAGLLLSGMTQPANIVGFLDVFGDWKPALILVMAGALGTYMVLHRLVLKRSAPLFDIAFNLPTDHKIDTRLIVGAMAFGVGWGVAGMCPGPSWVTLGLLAKEAVVFFVAMAAGVFLFNVASRNSATPFSDQDTCG